MMKSEYTQCMELSEKKRDLTFVVKGNGLKRKCDQEEMKTIEQDVLALEKLLEKYILKAVLFILFSSCSVLNVVLFCLPFSK